MHDSSSSSATLPTAGSSRSACRRSAGSPREAPALTKGSTRCADYSRRWDADAPLVVVFDDVHWAETIFLDLVEHVAESARGAPILLLLCMARPELLDIRPHWAGGKLNATTVLLEPLSESQCMELVSNLVGR